MCGMASDGSFFIRQMRGPSLPPCNYGVFCPHDTFIFIASQGCPNQHFLKIKMLGLPHPLHGHQGLPPADDGTPPLHGPLHVDMQGQIKYKKGMILIFMCINGVLIIRRIP